MKPEKKLVKFWSWPRLVPIGITAVVVVVLAVAALTLIDFSGKSGEKKVPLIISQSSYPEGAAGLFELKAQKEDVTGIEPGTAFELLAKAETSIEAIKSNLSFSPQVAYAVEKTNKNLYKITPSQPLNPGSIVGATLNVVYEGEGTSQNYQYSWTYEVQEKFQIVQTLPRHRAANVPADTGIEVTFSHVGFEKFEENFSITPRLEGRFEYHRKTAVFVPSQLLAVGTYYQVRIGQGVTLPATNETLEKEVVFGFETAPEYSENLDQQFIGFSQKTLESAVSEKPTIFVYSPNYSETNEVTLIIYQFNSSEEFKKAFDSYHNIPFWAQNSRDNWRYSTENLNKYAELTLPIVGDNYSWTKSVILPEALGTGYYLAEIKDEKTNQAFLQVSDLATYVTTSETNLVVWAHDSSLGNPKQDVQLTLSSGEDLGKTNNDGLLIAAMPKGLLDDVNSASITLVAQKDNDKLFVPLSGNAQGMGAYPPDIRRVQPYWSYLYLDQPFYRSNDAVNFWGVIEPRGGQEPLKQITVEYLTGYTYEENRSQVSKQVLSVSERGVFTGSLEAAGVAGSIAIVIGDQVVLEKEVQFIAYDKPTYSINIEPANIGVIGDQPVTHKIQAKLFDGTPVANQELTLDYSYPITTNESGESTITKTYGSPGQETVMDDTLVIYPAQEEQGEISASGRVRVFPSSQLIKLDSKTKAEKATIDGTLYTLDLEAFNKGQVAYYDLPYGEKVKNYPLKAKITRNWYTKEEAGTRYDYLQKKNIPEYNYVPHDETVTEQDITSNGQGEFSIDFNMVKDSYYNVAVSAQDQNGLKVSESTYVYYYGAGSGYNYGGNNNYLHLGIEDKEKEIPEFNVGDKVKVGFYKDAEKIPSSNVKQFLYLEAREGIKKATASSASDYEFTFGQEHIPNVVLQGVWFDGRSYWITDYDWGFGSPSISFKEKEKELSIEVKTDKESYCPGEEVNLGVEVKDKNGKGTASTVNLNLVDEAIYAIQNEEVDFNKSFYQDAGSGIYLSYATHRYPMPQGGAERGGGGSVRKNFKDRALFKTIETDKKGLAEVKFTLPDNLTSWRITAHALGNDQYAGSAISALKVTKPFMVDAIMSDHYLVDDQPYVEIRTFGSSLAKKALVELTISSGALPQEPISMNTVAYETVDVKLPALSLGQQELKIEAKSSGQEDSIIRSFTVNQSYLVAPVTQRDKVTAGWTPQVDTNEPIEVIFTDKHIGQYYPVLADLVYTYGDRLDQKIARSVSASLLNKYFAEDNQVETIERGIYQNQEGGAVMLFPYSDQDLLLSAHTAASALASQFNEEQLKKYFESILNDSSQTTLRHSQGLYGLAALRQPVLYEISQVLASDKITDTDRLYMALARTVLGDQEGSRQVFEALMDKYGKSQDQYLYLTLGETRDEQIENTMLAAQIAAELEDKRAESLFNYAQDNRVNETSVLLPQVNFLARRLESLPKDKVTIKYRHLGEEKTQELSEGKTEKVILTPKTKSDFKVLDVQGEVWAAVTYQRPLSAQEINLDSRVSLSRQYETLDIADGALVQVTLTPKISQDAPDGSYQVTDFVPAGFRVASPNLTWQIYGLYQNYSYSFPYDAQGVRVSFRTFKGDSTPITYLLRSVNKGTFVAEEPIIESVSSPSVRAGGEEQTVIVK